MRTGARLQAAIEVVTDIFERHRPAATALADWGKDHRFAGSGDRSAIGTLVYDVLRRRQSTAARMGADTPRALVLGAAQDALGLTSEVLIGAAEGDPHGLGALTEEERAGIARALPSDVPVHVAGDIPEWLAPSFARVFSERAVEEGMALSRRAPIDLRVNTLKATREKLLEELADMGVIPTPLSPIGVRIPALEANTRAPKVEATNAHGKGWFEVQDEGSQLAALLAGAGPREQVLDLCAGSGGKTLALAAAMQNTGQIYAYDSDATQLRPIFERMKRAGARSVQVLKAGDEAALMALGPRFDLVMIDAPCTGTGTWRRRPDSKWRLKPRNLADRQQQQRTLLTQASALVKPGGRIVYVTCSILPEENVDQIGWLVAQHSDISIVPWETAWAQHVGTAPPQSADGSTQTLQLTPARHATDGFFVAILARAE